METTAIVRERFTDLATENLVAGCRVRACRRLATARRSLPAQHPRHRFLDHRNRRDDTNRHKTAEQPAQATGAREPSFVDRLVGGLRVGRPGAGAVDASTRPLAIAPVCWHRRRLGNDHAVPTGDRENSLIEPRQAGDAPNRHGDFGVCVSSLPLNRRPTSVRTILANLRAGFERVG